jgi:hypothetical protein
MKRIIVLLSALLFGAGLCAQTTTAVSFGPTVDSDSMTWATGTWQLQFIPNPSFPQLSQYNINGTPLTQSVIFQSGTLSSGNGSFTTYQTPLITPIGSTYQLSICPNASSKCGILNFTTTGSTQDITASVNAAIPAPRFNAVPGTYGYADVEALLSLPVGATYWNTVNNCQRYNNGSSWACGSSAYTGTVSGQVVNTLPLSTVGGSIIDASSNITQTGSGASQIDTFPGSIQSVGSSASVSLNPNGGILQNMGTTANEQTLWGTRVGIGIPVPYVMPNGSAKNIAFDIVPLAGATNFSGSTGVAWTDICDGNFATACNQPGTVNYETIRLGIYSTGDGFLSSEFNGTGTIHNLLLQNTGGNVQIGSEGTTEPAWPLVVAETTNPAIQLTDGTGTNSCYLSKVSSSNSFISGAAANDQIDRCTGGNMLFGSNSSTPGPTLEITPGSPGTTESFGNFLVTDSHGSGSSQTNGASACSTLPTNFGTTSVNTGSATTSTVLSCLPANSVIDAITYRVTTAITTATSFTVGDSGSATRYSTCYFSGGAQALTLGATGVCNAGYYQIGGAALPVQLTFNATPGAGALRIIVYYHTWTPSSS